MLALPALTEMVGLGGEVVFYCNNQTFNPAYCDNGKSVTQQLEDGKRFFSGKYPEMKYLAYSKLIPTLTALIPIKGSMRKHLP